MKNWTNSFFLFLIVLSFLGCGNIVKKGVSEMGEEVSEKIIKRNANKGTGFFAKVARKLGIYSSESVANRIDRIAKNLPKDYFKNKQYFPDETDIIKFLDLYETNPTRLISKVKNNPNFLLGWNKLKGTKYLNDLDLINFFGAKNLDKTTLQITRKGLDVYNEGGKLLGNIDMDKRIMKVFVEKPNQSRKVVVKELNPLINQQYVRGTDPKLAQTLQPNFLIEVFQNSQKVITVQTDKLSRPTYYKCYPKLTKNPIRNTKEQVMSKHLRDGFDEDEGGHILASSLGGIAEQLNYLPMTTKINQSGGSFFKFENQLRELLKKGKGVYYEVHSSYTGGNMRPDKFRIIIHTAGSKEKVYNISNL